MAVGLLLGGAVNAAAYDGNAAAQWADNQALYPNCFISPCLTNDCTAFVSQALHFGGGYPYYGVGQNTHDDHYWWLKSIPYAGFAYSDSWGGIAHLYYFENVHIPGGTIYGSSVPGWYNAATGLSKGDLLFYDWTNNGIAYNDHVAMMVGSGQDPNSSYNGDLVDAHSVPHYHAFWTLAPWNSHVLVTKIFRMHIYATN